MNKVRSFYRDTLELGDPIVDSNFWLEFRLPGKGILAIEQANMASPNDNRQDVSVLIGVDDLDARLKTLLSKTVKPVLPSREIPGRQTASVRDPEGNLITLYARPASSDGKKTATIQKVDE